MLTLARIQGDDWLKHDRLILEVAYDPQVGLWRFHTERPDKERANHVTVLFDTMEAIAENVTVEELFYRRPPPTARPPPRSTRSNGRGAETAEGARVPAR